MSLTKKQQEILEIIKSFENTPHLNLTFRQLAEKSGFASTGPLYRHIRILREKGYLEKGSKKWYQFDAVQDTLPAVELVGSLSKEGILFSPSVQKKLFIKTEGSYAFTVNDDSFKSWHILKGDIVLISPVETTSNGSLVIARNSDNTISVSDRNELYAEDATYFGVITGVIRQYN